MFLWVLQDHFPGSKPRVFYITVFFKKSLKHYSCKDAWWVALSLV